MLTSDPGVVEVTKVVAMGAGAGVGVGDDEAGGDCDCDDETTVEDGKLEVVDG